ncbi:hypothetical protein [Aquabacterium sp.]|uniref:hypothetical protein n=1 Tax=Aquabacterium sp. TaxID=1872578 RepID=UPI0035B23988
MKDPRQIRHLFIFVLVALFAIYWLIHGFWWLLGIVVSSVFSQYALNYLNPFFLTIVELVIAVSPLAFIIAGGFFLKGR